MATCFVLCCLILYVQWARRRRRLYFLGAGIAFVLALLSKPTSTPLPILLLLLDYWPLRRMGKRALLEKIPLLAIAGAAAVITVVSQGQTAYLELPHLQSGARIPLTICHNVVFYLSKMVWPGSLTPHYPIPIRLTFLIRALAAWWPRHAGRVVAGVVLLDAGVAHRLAVVLVAIFPTLAIGFTNVITSDKYAYPPAVECADSGVRTDVWRSAARRLRCRLLVPVCVAIIALLEAAPRAASSPTENTEKLYWYMLTSRAGVFLHSEPKRNDQGRYEEAVARTAKCPPNSYGSQQPGDGADGHGTFGEAVHLKRPCDRRHNASTCNALAGHTGAGTG